MDVQTVKQKILKGEMMDEELSALLGKNVTNQDSFLKTLIKGFKDGYTTPNMYRTTVEAILILLVIVGIVILSYLGRIDAIGTSVLLAFVLGFLFGKIKGNI